MPEFDREGGSRRIFHFLEFLREDGWHVSFAAENGTGGERYARVLQQMGIPTYSLCRPWKGGEDARVEFDRLAGTGDFDVVLFAFWTCAETYMAAARRLSPDSLVVIDSIDIHFLRQSRRVLRDAGAAGSPPALDGAYADEARRELNAYAAADAVITVSQKEADLVNDFVGRRIAHAIPDTEDTDVPQVPLEDRRGMLFVGNFRHPPNVQAVEFLCRAIAPRIAPDILEVHPIFVVGNDPDEAVVDCCAGLEGVRLVGWVPSLAPYLARVRLSLIPLLYGAGTKRKLMQSLMVGTPSVSTPVGCEGLNLQHDRHLLIAADAAAFAADIERLVHDDPLWRRLAAEGKDFVRSVHGRKAVAARISEVFSQMAVSRGDASRLPRPSKALSNSSSGRPSRK